MVKNINSRQFLDKGLITTLGESDINKALDNIKGSHRREGRALLITLYYTGARPVEVLSLKGKDIKKEGSYIIVQTPAAKNGLARPIFLRYKHPLVKELYKYAIAIFEEMFLFFHFRSNSIKEYETRKGKKQIQELSNNLRYYFTKWFEGVVPGGINPYFLRHNRFSKLAAAGANEEQLRQIKGSKTLASVTPYSHLSSKSAKELARKID